MAWPTWRNATPSAPAPVVPLTKSSTLTVNEQLADLRRRMSAIEASRPILEAVAEFAEPFDQGQTYRATIKSHGVTIWTGREVVVRDVHREREQQYVDNGSPAWREPNWTDSTEIARRRAVTAAQDHARGALGLMLRPGAACPPDCGAA